MARSKIKGTSGKPVAKAKKKNSNRASITITEESYHPRFRPLNVTGVGKNDGDPSIYVKTPGDKKRAVRNRPEAANPVKDKPKYQGDSKVMMKLSTGRHNKDAPKVKAHIKRLKDASKKFKQ